MRRGLSGCTSRGRLCHAAFVQAVQLLYALQLAEADEHQSARCPDVQITADPACAAGAGSQCQIELMNADRSLMEDAAELGIVGDLMLSIDEIQNSGKTQPLATRLWFDATGDGILDA